MKTILNCQKCNGYHMQRWKRDGNRADTYDAGCEHTSRERRYCIETEDELGFITYQLVEEYTEDPVYIVGIDSPWLGKTLDELEDIWQRKVPSEEQMERAKVLKLIRQQRARDGGIS